MGRYNEKKMTDQPAEEKTKEEVSPQGVGSPVSDYMHCQGQTYTELHSPPTAGTVLWYFLHG